ncbi:MAG: hypothetical protein WD969_11200 [Paracoccaceae bacterium]
MRRAALALVFVAGAAAADGRITFWDGEMLREKADPMTAPAALQAGHQAFAVLVAPDVGLFIEAAVGASAHVSNLLAGALARRFSGHVDAARVLGAGRVFSIRPFVTVRGGVIEVDWRLRDEREAALGGVAATVRPGSPATFTAYDAERIAFQTAARLTDPDDLGAAFAAAAAMGRIDRVPSPAARPGSEVDEKSAGAPPMIAAAPVEIPEKAAARNPGPPAPLARPGG